MVGKKLRKFLIPTTTQSGLAYMATIQRLLGLILITGTNLKRCLINLKVSYILKSEKKTSPSNICNISYIELV